MNVLKAAFIIKGRAIQKKSRNMRDIPVTAAVRHPELLVVVFTSNPPQGVSLPGP
jgi:hypothetical protein